MGNLKSVVALRSQLFRKDLGRKRLSLGGLSNVGHDKRGIDRKQWFGSLLFYAVPDLVYKLTVNMDLDFHNA
jgi:hypothetical protein